MDENENCFQSISNTNLKNLDWFNSKSFGSQFFDINMNVYHLRMKIQFLLLGFLLRKDSKFTDLVRRESYFLPDSAFLSSSKFPSEFLKSSRQNLKFPAHVKLCPDGSFMHKVANLWEFCIILEKNCKTISFVFCGNS